MLIFCLTVDPREMPDLKLSIKAVSRKTGLSPHVIRTWEKRYRTVSPVRSGGNQRLYSSEDVEKLSLLKRATEAGHSIGTVATLSVERLRTLVGGDAGSRGAQPILGSFAREGAFDELPLPFRREAAPAATPSYPVEAEDFLKSALQAVTRMDSNSLEQVLDKASMALGQMRLLGELIVPLVEEIGSAWERGDLKISHEHMATAVLRTFLGNVARPIALHPRAPGILITTPAGQIHELGAILVAAAASGLGWKIVYCGPSMPAEEIASAAAQNPVRAVGLSVVHPSDDPTLGQELMRLRRLLPKETVILVGGRASSAYAAQIAAAGAVRVGSLQEFSGILNGLRQAPPAG